MTQNLTSYDNDIEKIFSFFLECLRRRPANNFERSSEQVRGRTQKRQAGGQRTVDVSADGRRIPRNGQVDHRHRGRRSGKGPVRSGFWRNRSSKDH